MVDKPVGPTSHDIIDAVRRGFGTRRVGHSGTLDPFASGLLMVFLDKGTRLIRFLEPLAKTYTGELQLGVTTDTLDSTGTETARKVVPADLDDGRVREVFADLVGTIQQIPPAFSAKKVNGVPAYERARRGESVELKPVEVTIHRLEMTARTGDLVSFEAVVSSGTYIRAIARDVGTALGTGAHLRELRRTAVGGFSVDAATPPELLSRANELPLVRAMEHLADIAIDEAELGEILHGRPLSVRAGGPQEGGSVALIHDGELVAVAEVRSELLQPRVVVAE